MNYLAKLADVLRSLGLLHSDIEKVSRSIDTASADYHAEKEHSRTQQPVILGELRRPQPEIDAEESRESRKEARAGRHEERDSARLRFESAGLLIAAALAVANIGLWIATMRGVKIAAISAKASQESVQAAKQSIESSIRTSELDQRPWVYVSSLNLTREPEENKEGPKIGVSVMNSGKTMALHVIPIYETGSAPFDKVPPFPKNFTPQEPIQLGILPPNAGNFGFPTIPMKSITDPVQLAGYNRGAAIIYIHVKLTYSDIFGNTYWTTICGFHTHGTPLNFFTLCKHGNEIGQEK